MTASEYKAWMIECILEWQTRNQFTRGELEVKRIGALERIFDNVD